MVFVFAQLIVRQAIECVSLQFIYFTVIILIECNGIAM